MKENKIIDSPRKYKATVFLKSNLEDEIIWIIVNNLSCTNKGVEQMIAKKSKEGEHCFRSQERIRLTYKDEDKVVIESEQFSYFLSICVDLNAFELEYILDIPSHLIEICSEANEHNIYELIEDIDF